MSSSLQNYKDGKAFTEQYAKGIDHIQILIRLHQSNGHSDVLSLIQVNVLNLSVGKI